jgi:hypothetical protein
VRHISAVGPRSGVAQSARAQTIHTDAERSSDRPDGLPRAVASVGGLGRSAAICVSVARPDLDGAVHHAVVGGSLPLTRQRRHFPRRRRRNSGMTRRTARQLQLQLIVRRAERDALVMPPASEARARRGVSTARMQARDYGDAAA